MSNIEIKMGSKLTNEHADKGIITSVVHTGKLANSPILEVNKIEGMEELIVEKKNTVKMISIDNNQMQLLLDFCAEDLMTKRKMRINGSDEIVSLVTEYNKVNRIITFGFNIKELNKLFDMKNGELSDFLSNFFYSNINKYSEILFKAIPEELPITSMDTLQGNKVIIQIH